MPKTIDYPRTTYQSAWEVSEVVDDTGGKCSLETCARKLNRKVSGSFKAILGSAVKFGLLTSKRELLTTTNLFRRIKHAYDKQEEMLYHREAFLHPPLFTQICRKFRNRELPVHMFDIMLIREFGVEEINAQTVAKAFVEGARMTSLLDERNVIADIDQLAAQQGPRRELATGEMPLNLFQGKGTAGPKETMETGNTEDSSAPVVQAVTPLLASQTHENTTTSNPPTRSFVPSPPMGRASMPPTSDPDPISALFGLNSSVSGTPAPPNRSPVSAADLDLEVYTAPEPSRPPTNNTDVPDASSPARTSAKGASPLTSDSGNPLTFMIHISGPGLDTQLHIQDADDLEIVKILLDKIRKRLG